MATITLKGSPVKTSGELPKTGTKAPDFSLTANDLSTKTLADYKGNQLILNVFPSIDTDTCAQSVRTFNETATKLKNTKVLNISKDLPFAQSRFCAIEGIKNAETLSDFKTNTFAKDYGLEITSGPLETLLSRCVIVVNSEGDVVYTEQVKEIVDEPNYQAALDVLS